ncbi:MAG: DUF362 domain-containing protein [Halanaerobiales bacterium]
MSDIGVIYGDNGKVLVKELLQKYNPFSDVSDLQSMSIGIKPNLLKASPSEEGATTDPEIVAGIIEYLKEQGVNDINIMESSWVGGNTERAFTVCGYKSLAEKYKVNLYNLTGDKYFTENFRGEQIKIYQKLRDIDYLINVPVLKAHCQTNITCALKNMKGCIPDSEKRRFHSLGLHKPIALLNNIVKSDLIIVDGIYGDLTFEEGGNPVKMDRIIISKDPVLIDTYAARLLGYDKKDIKYIEYAEEMGAGSTDLKEEDIVSYNSPETVDNIPPKSNRIVKRLSKYIEENSSCSACYGNLIHALYQLQKNNRLKQLQPKIYIGQGYTDKTETGIGIGKCTSGFDKNVRGCPPSTKSIIDFLQDNLSG